METSKAMLASSLRRRILIPRTLIGAVGGRGESSSASSSRFRQTNPLVRFRRSLSETKLPKGLHYDETPQHLTRSLSSTTASSPTAVTPLQEETTTTPKDPVDGLFSSPVSLPRIYRYLDLKDFTKEEMEDVFDRIARADDNPSADDNDDASAITQRHLQAFLLERIHELEKESHEISPLTPEADFLRQKFVQAESVRTWNKLFDGQETVRRQDFCHILRERATKVDFVRTLPIISSMLIVGASVGVITPAMPFVVDNLGITASQYGLVVSAFALSKMAANIPSAIFVERHGRKPYMVHSMLVIALGVGGIGLASSFEELYLCRLLTGTGVSFLRYVIGVQHCVLKEFVSTVAHFCMHHMIKVEPLP